MLACDSLRNFDCIFKRSLVGFRTARLVGFAVALGRRTGARFVAVNWGAGDLSG